MRLFPRRPKCSFCSCLFLAILATIVIGGYFFLKEIGIKDKWHNFIYLLETKGKIELENKTKEELKEQGKKVEGKIYEEATKHNPKGDVLPDEVDDKLKEEIKKEVKKRVE